MARATIGARPRQRKTMLRPENWHTDAGDAEIATLDIPPALGRVRRFHIDVRFVVHCPADGTPAWHALTVEANGRRQWQRRIATSNPGATDSLDYAFTTEVPEGAALRVRALTRVQGALRRRLRIEAVEQ
jgi:hypothetical protein